MLPHHETECQRSVNNVWSCMLGSQGFARINELITELLTAFLSKNTKNDRKNPDSEIIIIADCRTCRKWLLAVEYLILIIYYYQTAKTRTLYKSTDGPGGRPSDNPANSEDLGDSHWSMPELTVHLYRQPGRPICEWFSSDPDRDLKWQSGTVANTAPIDESRSCMFQILSPMRSQLSLGNPEIHSSFWESTSQISLTD